MGLSEQMKELYLNVLILFLKSINSIYRRFNNNEFELSSIKNILFMHTMMIGDSVLTLPALNLLHRRFPSAKIIILTTEISKDVFSTLDFIDNILMYNPYTEKNRFRFLRLTKVLRSMKFDLVIDTQDTLVNLKRSLLPFLVAAKYRVYYRSGGFEGLLPSIEVEYSKKYLTKLHSELVESIIGKSYSLIDLKINIDENDVSNLKKKLLEKSINSSNMMLIHPSVSSNLKLWSQEKMARVASYLQQKYEFTIIITGDKRDVKYNEELTNFIHAGEVFDLSGELSLKELMSLISISKLLICIDTSVFHIATATKTPTLALFGPTIKEFWAPENNFQKIISKPLICLGKCREINLDKVLSNKKICTEKENTCLTQINVEEVINEAENLIQNMYGKLV